MSDTSLARRVRSIVLAVILFLALIAAGVVIAWQLTGAVSLADLLTRLQLEGF